MNSESFLKRLTAVLSDVPDIPGLHSNQWEFVSDGEATPLHAVVSNEAHVRLIRLQTMRIMEQKALEAFETEKTTLPPIPEKEAQQKAFIQETSDLLDRQVISRARVKLLEHLMIEAVRAAVPSECDNHDVDYIIHPSRSIAWNRRPIEDLRFLGDRELDSV